MHLMLDINVDRIVPSCLQLSHPGSSFDISFVRLFRTLDNIRYIWYLSSLPHSFAKVANCHHQGDKEIIHYQFLLSLTLFWQYWPMKGFLFWTIYSKTFVIQLLYLTTNLRRLIISGFKCPLLAFCTINFYPIVDFFVVIVDSLYVLYNSD